MRKICNCGTVVSEDGVPSDGNTQVVRLRAGDSQETCKGCATNPLTFAPPPPPAPVVAVTPSARAKAKRAP